MRKDIVVGFSVCSFVHPWSVACQSVRCPLVWCNISSLSGRTSMKLATNFRHTSGHCWKSFQGQRSKVKVTTRSINVWWRRHTFRRCDVKAALVYEHKLTLQCFIIIILSQFFYLYILYYIIFYIIILSVTLTNSGMDRPTTVERWSVRSERPVAKNLDLLAILV